jgi:hypothetical protein
MTRKPVELRLTEENIGVALVLGDIIQEAEELGQVVSARMTVHNNGTAFVYFMGGDCYKETFAIPQTLTVLRDPNGPEYEWVGRPIGTHGMVEISKTGGGRVGRRYQGTWTYRVTRNGKVVAEGDDLKTGMPKTHEEAARHLWGFLDDTYDAGQED